MEIQSRSSGASLQIIKTSDKTNDSGEIISVAEGRWFKSPSASVEGAMSALELIKEYCEEDSTFAESMRLARVSVARKNYSNETSLRVLRLEKGISQQELASALGSHQSYIARIEGGRLWPNQDFIQKLATFFGKGFGEMCELLPKA